jgi:hypothetical protein
MKLQFSLATLPVRRHLCYRKMVTGKTNRYTVPKGLCCGEV